MVIRRVSPLSCAKIAGTLYALMGLIFGAIVSLIALAGGLASNNAEGAAFSAVFGAGAVVILPLFYGVAGFVLTAFSAWLYNIVAGMVGGIEIDVQ